jgi:hypothetical protein
MFPICMTTTAVVAASTSSGAAVLGFVAFTFRALRRHHGRPSAADVTRASRGRNGPMPARESLANERLTHTALDGTIVARKI